MKKLQYSIIGLCTCIALFSCEKEENNIGASAGGDLGNVSADIVDTFQIVTYNGLKDSLPTGHQFTPQLGAYHSNEMGIVQSAIYASLKPDSTGKQFPTSNFAIDTFYLSLHIVDVYGNPMNQEFDVYRLEEAVSKDSVYLGSSSLPYTDLMGTITVNESDSGLYTFNLDETYAVNLLAADSADLATTSNFREFFKGIAIVPKTDALGSNSGAIYDLERSGIDLHLKYHSTDLNPTGNYDTDMSFIVSNTDSLIFSSTYTDPTGSEVESVLNDSTLGQSYFYTQGLQAAIGKINFPTLQNWYDDSLNYLINKMEFTIYVEDNSTYTLPDQLQLFYDNTNGNRAYAVGTLDPTESSYVFSISPSELDAQLKAGTLKDMDFSIEVPFSAINANQVKIHGGNGLNPPVLKVYYTKY